MNVLGIGTDILSFERILEGVHSMDDPFIKKVFTQEEINQSYTRSSWMIYLATRFAGKEAVFKSLGIDGNRIDMREIEILNDEKGAPLVHLYGKIKEIAHGKGIEKVLISLSYDRDYVISYATAVGMK